MGVFGCVSVCLCDCVIVIGNGNERVDKFNNMKTMCKQLCNLGG